MPDYGFGSDFFDAALGRASEPISAFLESQVQPPAGGQFTQPGYQPGGASFTEHYAQPGSTGVEDFMRPLQSEIGTPFGGQQQVDPTGYERAVAQRGTIQQQLAQKEQLTPTKPMTRSSVSIPRPSGDAVEPNRASPYYQLAAQEAVAAGIDPDIFTRQMSWESGGFDPEVIAGRRASPRGALGIAQFMPDTARGLGVDPLDPMASLKAAARLMRVLVDKYGSYQNALIAYNGGEGNLQSGAWAAIGEIQQYLRSVLGTNPAASQQGIAPTTTTNALPATGYQTTLAFGAPYQNPIVSDITGQLVYNHRGIDLIVPNAPEGGRGSPVGTFVSGQVAYVGRDNNAGNYVVIQDQQGLYHWYMHLDSQAVRVGQQIAKGAVVGTLGNTGSENEGAHLHYEVRVGSPNGEAIDPIPFMVSGQ